MLAQRAVSEDPRWTRAVEGSIGPSRVNSDKQAWKSYRYVLAAALLDGLFEHPAWRTSFILDVRTHEILACDRAYAPAGARCCFARPTSCSNPVASLIAISDRTFLSNRIFAFFRALINRP